MNDQTQTDDKSMYPDYTTIAERQQQLMAPHYVVNGGGKWDETNSRIHSCEVIYRDKNYIEQRIRRWATSIEGAYAAARDACLAEREAGRAL